ncbi:bumetanide-sensitive sodium-(potassium)-chloride cotransporter-like isoform X2 [Ostrinia nubilalis]|uniref:bumetanide-sensitive sodium-(potassium)-chloride cotransporter-like isoform X2 n=1 Tax=Ostrinia nubilalis TaxID=29057 RepID=UPI0030822C4C
MEDDEPLLNYCEMLAPKTFRQKSNDGRSFIKIVTEEDRITHSSQAHVIDPTPELTTFGGIKLGWIQGVLIPCLLNIWGVMLFLRIAWIVAQAGIGLTIVIIFVSSLVCIITTLSLSAICTNGRVQGGGVYYLVSRSLGAELGASVGIIFAFANAVAASMNTIGFCESFNELLRLHGLKILDNSVNDVRIVGAIALLIMCIICAIGMDWETKAQNFLIVIIVVAIFNYVIGSFIGPRNNNHRSKGFVGLNSKTAADNWGPDFRQNNDIFSVFAMYFPAVTGVQAGANICGDLKNPATAIPKGTFTALVISISTYLFMALLAGTGAERDASGRVSDLNNQTLDSCKPACKYGLHNNYEIMQLMSIWGPIIYAGCWAATLSTALTNLLSVPRLIQALGIDRIYPGLLFFSKPYGKHGEPYRGYVLTFLVSLLFLLIGDLDKIAPLITNFYLASYALINFCTFHAAFIHHISWRPTFRYYNTWLSLAGFLLCAGIMVVISWLMSLITVAIFVTLYLVVLYRQPAASWGSSTEAYRYRETVNAILTMTQRTGHIKSYNPQLLVLTGKPMARVALLDVAHLITKVGSFMIVADITTKLKTYHDISERKQAVNTWLASRKYRSFYVIVQADLESGVRSLVQCAGLGRVAPNVLLVGYKGDWNRCTHKALATYVRILRYAFENQLAVCILRMPFLKSSGSSTRVGGADSLAMIAQSRVLAVMHSSSNFQLQDDDSEEEEVEETEVKEPLDGDRTDRFPEVPPPAESITTLSTLPPPPPQNKSNLSKPFALHSTSTLDTWWLYDDGGLNMLLPYIIANRGFKEKMPLRIFSLARPHHKIEAAQKYMEDLLSMFRIEYDKLQMVTTLGNRPSEESWNLFDRLVLNFKDIENEECLITKEELKRQKDRTSRHLRLRELLLENSSEAGLIVLSLPIPRQGTSAALYMAWLEAMSYDLPPMLFVRGNDVSVLNM